MRIVGNNKSGLHDVKVGRVGRVQSIVTDGATRREVEKSKSIVSNAAKLLERFGNLKNERS